MAHRGEKPGERLFIYSANEDKKYMKVGESLGGVNTLKKISAGQAVWQTNVIFKAPVCL